MSSLQGVSLEMMQHFYHTGRPIMIACCYIYSCVRSYMLHMCWGGMMTEHCNQGGRGPPKSATVHNI